MNNQQSYYETMYILRPDIAEDEVNNHIDKYNKLLEEFGGTILDSQMRGKRRLAYQIAKHREGIYVQLSHQGDGQHIFKIEKAMRLSEDVIRYMTVKQEGPLPTPRTSNKSTSQSENKDNPETKVESKEKKPVSSADSSTGGKDENINTELNIRKSGSAALDMAYVASGRFDGYFQKNLNLWDIAAGIILVKEAGGIVNEIDTSKNKNIKITAASSVINDKMLEKLSNF